jgi:hypothetical protein
MTKQIFKKNVPIHILYDLLEKICLKTERYYFIDNNAFKKMIHLELHTDFLKTITSYYHSSKIFYVEREFKYNSFKTIVSQICKSNNIIFTSQIKYNESKYNIHYFVYFDNNMNIQMNINQH